MSTDESGGRRRRQVLKGAAAFGRRRGLHRELAAGRGPRRRSRIIIGLTCDATGTFADSGQADRRGHDPRHRGAERPGRRAGPAHRVPVGGHRDRRLGGGAQGPAAHRAGQDRLHDRRPVAAAWRRRSRSSPSATGSSTSTRTPAPTPCPTRSASASTSCGTPTARCSPRRWDRWWPRTSGKKWFLLTHDYVWGKNVTAGHPRTS